VGKRVVAQLLGAGRRVRALVRDVNKAKALLVGEGRGVRDEGGRAGRRRGGGGCRERGGGEKHVMQEKYDSWMEAAMSLVMSNDPGSGCRVHPAMEGKCGLVLRNPS
jgi:hypothetical protein